MADWAQIDVQGVQPDQAALNLALSHALQLVGVLDYLHSDLGLAYVDLKPGGRLQFFRYKVFFPS